MSNLKLSKEETIKEHRKMWNWIADEIMQLDENETVSIVDLKLSYFKTHEIPEHQIPEMHCYCCSYAIFITNDSDSFCKNCPIVWTKDAIDNKCVSLCSPYDKLNHLLPLRHEGIDRKYLSSLAREIANLPERDDKR